MKRNIWLTTMLNQQIIWTVIYTFVTENVIHKLLPLPDTVKQIF